MARRASVKKLNAMITPEPSTQEVEAATMGLPKRECPYCAGQLCLDSKFRPENIRRSEGPQYEGLLHLPELNLLRNWLC